MTPIAMVSKYPDKHIKLKQNIWENWEESFPDLSPLERCFCWFRDNWLSSEPWGYAGSVRNEPWWQFANYLAMEMMIYLQTIFGIEEKRKLQSNSFCSHVFFTSEKNISVPQISQSENKVPGRQVRAVLFCCFFCSIYVCLSKSSHD